jgi:competence protein ComEC
MTSRALFWGALGLLGSLSAVSPWPSLLVVLVASGVALVRGSTFRVVLFGVLGFCITGVRAKSKMDDFLSVRSEFLHTLEGVERCVARVRVVSSPTVSVDETTSEMQSLWLGETEKLECGDRSWERPELIRLASSRTDVVRGDEFWAVMQLGVVQYFQNEGSLDPRPGAARRGARLSGSLVLLSELEPGSGVGSLIDRFRAHVRRRIFATFRREVIPLSRALVLGENDLTVDEALAFSKSGLMHILAVSGTHLVLAVVSLERGLFALLARIGPLASRFDVARFTGAIGTLLAFLYCDFAGGSGSARRAAFMLAVVLGGRAFGYRIGGSVALGSSILIGLSIDPLVGFDISFLLSALATLGLLFIAQPLTRFIEARLTAPFWVKTPILVMGTTLSSSVACAPLLAFLGGQMTFAALFANLIAGPAGEILALPACLLHAATSAFPSLERGLAMVGGGALYIVRGAALVSANSEALAFQLPWPSARGTAILAVVGVGLEAIRNLSGLRRSVVSVLVAAGSLVVARYAVPSPLSEGKILSLTMLDVGQGDALFVRLPTGETALIDGGGYPNDQPSVGRRVLLPFLRAVGQNRLDFMVLSHADRDHLLGLLDVAREVRVREFWYRGGSETSTDLETLLTSLKAQGTRLRTAKELCGQTRDFGATISVIAPCGETADELNRNDGSLIVKLSYGNYRALLGGDVEVAGEEALLETNLDLKADLLKVAHHGSRTSTSDDWVERVRPEVALISVGARNTFGHPSRDVLTRLAERGTRVFRTDEKGALTWSTDGKKAFISSYADRAPAPLSRLGAGAK